MQTASQRRWRAIQMLVLATAFWGLSFPVMKSLGLLQLDLVPHNNTWFGSALVLFVRFAIAGVIMLAVSLRTIRGLTRLEVYQGIGLGVFNGVGMLFQMDGLAYTSASTSAFLTQGYCLIIPIVVALRDRRWPPIAVFVSCVLMLVGAAFLTGQSLSSIKLGRGEIETLIGSAVFTGQILWLERPIFARNNVNRFTVVMFASIAALALPVALLNARAPSDLITAFNSREVIALTMVLVLFCTMISYVLMNYFQPALPATEAGLIYGAEPLFASLFALFLPAMLTVYTGLAYANETLTRNLLIGGMLIIAANVLIQLKGHQAPPRETTQG